MESIHIATAVEWQQTLTRQNRLNKTEGMHMIRREARRILISPLAWFCVFIYTAVMLMGIAETLKVKEAVIDTGWLDQLCQTEEYGITVLVKNLVFPMSVASVYFDEKKGKCDWVKMMRTSRFHYCVTKAIAVFAGSIFLYIMSVLAFVAIGSMMHPEILTVTKNSFLLTGEMWQRWIQDGNYWAVFFLYIVLNALHVAAWSSMLGLCVSVFSENRYVVAAVPFFINRNFLYLGDKVDGLSMLSPYQYRPTQFWFTGTPMDLFLLVLKNLAVLFLFTFIFIKEIKWRSLHG